MNKKKKVIYLNENMGDENGNEIFQADIPYKIENGFIENEDGLKISLNDIWVDFSLEHKNWWEKFSVSLKCGEL